MGKFKDVIYEFAIYVGRFSKPVIFTSLEVTKELSRKSKFLGIIQFLQEHKEELIYLERDQFKLRDLGEVFSIKSCSLRAFDLYFKERARMKFFKREGHVYARVSDFVFIIPFPHGIFELAETFYHGCYDVFDVSNGNVVDVGAFMGDTAVYFASKGAKKVVAFEPAKHLFSYALKNVQLNGLGDVIDVKNEAIGVDYGEEKFYYLESQPGASSILPKKGSICYKVKVVPLSSVMAEFDHVDLLKLDCEGMEDKILLQAYRAELLKNISNIIVEVHDSQKLKTITDILEKASYKIIKHDSAKNLWLLSATKALPS
jgi:FkbM family methyltransferase